MTQPKLITVPGITEDGELRIQPTNGWYDGADTVCTVKLTSIYDGEDATVELTRERAEEAAISIIQAFPDDDKNWAAVHNGGVWLFDQPLSKEAAIDVALSLLRAAR